MPACSTCGRGIDGDFAFCPHCGADLAAAAPSREQRKTVTVLFCDVTGSTALGESVDPEALRALLARYFERMKGIVEVHGGTVEKFIGDAVMAVFGVPVAHEDDALRAVRAAVEMRDALPELGVHARLGVNTGEVVTGTEERLATGDAVNVAARLEQAAAPDEVLLGDSTLALLGDAVEAETVEPLELKGKTERIPAYRLICVRDAPARHHEAKFVGRRRELAILHEAWERVQTEQRCELVTLVADAGVGKTRLAAEALASLDATIARGRCLPYGEGITYWPVVEVLKQLDALPPDETAAAAIRSLLGETEAPTSAEEIAWAFRKTLEHAAAARPLVVVFEDVHWGEETFLDLMEHVALLSSGAAILLLCIARPEFIERRSAWPVTLRLAPLGGDDVEELIPAHIAGELRERITTAAGGNPLFVREMVAMAGEAEGEIVVPPTLQALLAARLDQLEATERSVLERGAVEGEIFHRGAVQTLVAGGIQVTPRLAALVRKELIRPHRPQLEGEDGFRFRHLLIRDAAYDALPKATRAELHERFAVWLEEHGADLVELDEIVGYHLEQACRYRAELGLATNEQLAASARRRLAAAGRRASLRTDYGAAVNLLQRAVSVGPPDQLDLGLELDLADALLDAGRGEAAVRQAQSAAKRAARAGNEIGERCARIHEARIRTFFEPEGATEDLDALIREALPIFEAAGDDFALFTAYWALGQVANMRAQMDADLEAFERAAVYARRLGLPNEFLGWRAGARLHGTTPVPDVLAWLDEQEQKGRSHLTLRRDRAVALAMLGRVEDARAIMADVCAEMADRGGGLRLGTTTGQAAVNVELLAGNAAAAVEFGREGCRLLYELGERSFLSTSAGHLAQALYAVDSLDEADEWARRAAELGASDDALTQMLSLQVRAKLLARRGEHAEAERLAREAVAIAGGTDMLNAQAAAWADLAEVLSLAGRAEDAAEAFEQALARYERKGNVVMAGRMRDRLAELQAAVR